MKKLKTLFRYIKNIDYKNMFKIVKKISIKANKNYIYILLDVIYCGFKYGAGYYDYQEFEFYLLNKEERKTYLTRAKNNEIIKTFNNQKSFYKLNNKALFNKEFKNYINRSFLLINKDNFNEFKNFIETNKTIIVKPLEGEGGIGIEKYYITDKTNKKRLFNKLIKNNQNLIEECVEQHSKINKLYKESVNTLRLFTFNDGKHSYVVNSVFKLGNGGVTDNFSSGGMYTFVDEKGKVIVPAIDKEDNIHTIHPITKEKIVGFIVPEYIEACDLVKKASNMVKEIGYIGWDVAISNKGPVIIEGNPFPGVFQIKPSLVDKKEGLIPKYNKVMKIFSNNKRSS